MRVMHVVGTRPNFMKIAPIVREMERQSDIEQRLIHTGQHYDERMSRVFFEDLGLPFPDVDLGVGSGSHAVQTAGVMLALDRVLQAGHPDWVVVVGDVNSTLAAALVAKKLQLQVAHVEAGLRSFDRTMPEEHNRVLTDHLSDLLFTPSADAHDNLMREGIPDARIEFVGNVMIDTLVRLLPLTSHRTVLAELGLVADDGSQCPYLLVTLHRPANVDQFEVLQRILRALNVIASRIPVVFPLHPRTRGMISEFGLYVTNVRFVEALGYIDFLALERHAALVLTDSGGVQEETTYLGVPCLTLRANTERPITIWRGTNRLVSSDPDVLIGAMEGALGQANVQRPLEPPELWDGRTAERIVAALRQFPGTSSSG